MNRDSILKGIGAAEDFLNEIKYDPFSVSSDYVDIFKIIKDKDINCRIDNLGNLLGLCFTDSVQGMAVTANRTLPIQRFTAAHELGHLYLKHKTSLDTEKDINPYVNSKKYNLSPQEVEANSFASSILLPSELLTKVGRSLNLTTEESITNPENIYQMSLRTCTSYAAMCYALSRNFYAHGFDFDKSFKVSPKLFKQSLLEGLKLENSWADVWKLGPSDSGKTFLGGPDDFFILELPEHGPSGYVWNIEELENYGLIIVQESREKLTSKIGAPTKRKIVFKAKEAANFSIILKEIRPWEKGESFLNKFELNLNLFGQENYGLTRYEKQVNIERFAEAA